MCTQAALGDAKSESMAEFRNCCSWCKQIAVIWNPAGDMSATGNGRLAETTFLFSKPEVVQKGLSDVCDTHIFMYS